MNHILTTTSKAVLISAVGLMIACSGSDPSGSHIDASSNAVIEGETTAATFCVVSGASVSGVDFTNGQASNVIDFVDNASEAELMAITGIGESIAQRIVDARPFGAAARPLDAFDAVGYVGAKVLANVRDQTEEYWCSLSDGRQTCCSGGCDGLGDTIESYVEYTDAQAHLVLDWANHASDEQLQQVCYVGPTVAGDIIDARPILNIADLADVPRIGSHMVQNFIGQPLFSCATKGTVDSTWCDSPEANCICEASNPEPCNTPGAHDVEVLEADLPAEIVSLLSEWTAEPHLCDSVQVTYPQFADAFAHYQDCAITGYTVTLIQMIDPEGGIYYLIPFELDADFDETDMSCSI